MSKREHYDGYRKNPNDKIYMMMNRKDVEAYQKSYEEIDIFLKQFPHLRHVETVALLSKLDVNKHISVEIELVEMDLTSAESKATYKQIQNYVLEKFGFKVSTLYIAQVKKKHGLEVREHYNMFKNEKQKIQKCPIEKEEAILGAFKYFKMIEDDF